MLNGEVIQQTQHGALLLLFNPLLLVRLEEKFVELGHKSKASPLVEEVKLLVILIVHTHRLRGSCRSLILFSLLGF